MYTPEGHSLEPCDMAWWSLTCNIAREWRTLMDEARVGASPGGSTGGNNVIHLREVLHARQKKRFGGVAAGPDAEPTRGVLQLLGPNPPRRG